MDLLWTELSAGLPDGEELARVTVRMLVAALVGGLLGFERERVGKSAGLRTHMLVSLSSALFVVSSLEADMPMADISRVVQGIATGIGFLGGGAILKLSAEREIHGLTTAANIWITAAGGVAAGLGRIGLALMTILFGLIVLAVLAQFEGERKDKHRHL